MNEDEIRYLKHSEQDAMHLGAKIQEIYCFVQDKRKNMDDCETDVFLCALMSKIEDYFPFIVVNEDDEELKY